MINEKNKPMEEITDEEFLRRSMAIMRGLELHNAFRRLRGSEPKKEVECGYRLERMINPDGTKTSYFRKTAVKIGTGNTDDGSYTTAK